MEQGGFGGQYETGMSSRGCRTTGFRSTYVRFKPRADINLGNCNVCFTSNSKPDQA